MTEIAKSIAQLADLQEAKHKVLRAIATYIATDKELSVHTARTRIAKKRFRKIANVNFHPTVWDEIWKEVEQVQLNEVDTKICTKCGRSLPITKFGKGNDPNKLNYMCRDCLHAYAKIYRNRVKQQKKENYIRRKLVKVTKLSPEVKEFFEEAKKRYQQTTLRIQQEALAKAKEEQEAKEKKEVTEIKRKYAIMERLYLVMHP